MRLFLLPWVSLKGRHLPPSLYTSSGKMSPWASFAATDSHVIQDVLCLQRDSWDFGTIPLFYSLSHFLSVSWFNQLCTIREWWAPLLQDVLYNMILRFGQCLLSFLFISTLVSFWEEELNLVKEGLILPIDLEKTVIESRGITSGHPQS